NAQLKKGGESTLQFAEVTDASTKAEAARQADIFKSIGASDTLVDAFRQGTVFVRGLSSGDQAGRLLQALQFANQVPDLSLLIQQQQPAIAAQRALFRQQAEDQRRLLLPAQF